MVFELTATVHNGSAVYIWKQGKCYIICPFYTQISTGIHVYNCMEGIKCNGVCGWSFCALQVYRL